MEILLINHLLKKHNLMYEFLFTELMDFKFIFNHHSLKIIKDNVSFIRKINLMYFVLVF